MTFFVQFYQTLKALPHNFQIKNKQLVFSSASGFDSFHATRHLLILRSAVINNLQYIVLLESNSFEPEKLERPGGDILPCSICGTVNTGIGVIGNKLA
jgi:hypothetical protein